MVTDFTFPTLVNEFTFSTVVNRVIQPHADRTGTGIARGFRRQQTQVTALGVLAWVGT